MFCSCFLDFPETARRHMTCRQVAPSFHSFGHFWYFGVSVMWPWCLYARMWIFHVLIVYAYANYVGRHDFWFEIEGLGFMMKTTRNNAYYVNGWWVGFTELRSICRMYECGMMLWYKIMFVWKGGARMKVLVCFGAGEIWKFPDMYAPPDDAWIVVRRSDGAVGVMQVCLGFWPLGV